jgi:transcriptional regulator with XRE-family HTH domain
MSDGNELGPFLRARRERVTPADHGLVARGRRRTPGLRREELASLAGISVDYLVRLEQGRERSPSASVVAALADALLLDLSERRHMWSLVAHSAQAEMCPKAVGAPAVDPSTEVLLDRLDGTPAFVMDRTTTVHAWNDAYDRVVRPLGLLDRDPPNLLRFTFLDEAARRVYPDWAALAREQVGNLRAASAFGPDDGALAALVGELTLASPDFSRLWAAHDVDEKGRGTTRFLHPAAGPLTVGFTAMKLPEGWLHLVAYLPADAATAAAFDRLFAPAASAASAARVGGAGPGGPGGHGHLRVVETGT